MVVVCPDQALGRPPKQITSPLAAVALVRHKFSLAGSVEGNNWC
jgi:hypothetical protein